MTNRLATTAGAIVAALTLSASVANAAAPTVSNRVTGAAGGNHAAGDCSDVYGRWWADAALAAQRAAAPQADPAAEETEPEEESPEGERPQNHGWFVSQAAHDKSTTGAAHGKAVSAVARGDDGKPESAEH